MLVQAETARRIGRVVKSNGHADYVVQVFRPGEVPLPPRPSDYAVGTFVAIGAESGQLIGVVYDTILLNPDYGSLGPRLSPRDEAQVFSPDYLDERATLVGVVVVGEVLTDGAVSHELPPVSAEVDADALALTDEQILRFHQTPAEPAMPRMGYLPRLLLHGGPVAPGVAQLVLTRLRQQFPAQQGVLRVLRDNVAFRATVEVLR